MLHCVSTRSEALSRMRRKAADPWGCRRDSNFRRQTMTDPVVDKIQRHPKYQELRSRRNRLGLFLTLLMLVVYYGYIALIAFDKSFLAQPIGAGVTSQIGRASCRERV